MDGKWLSGCNSWKIDLLYECTICSMLGTGEGGEVSQRKSDERELQFNQTLCMALVLMYSLKLRPSALHQARATWRFCVNLSFDNMYLLWPIPPMASCIRN